jgi:dTDP-4-dehydrorhamnose reductase
LKTILITGANGQLGRSLALRFKDASLASSSTLKVVSLDRSQLDLAHPEAIREVLRDIRPSFVLNAAAHTAVDQAELEPDLAHAINTQAPQVLAEEAKALGASLIHYSTDYVFDGLGQRPYRETDLCNPQSVYGASKLAGEKAIAQVGGKHLIFRTSWVYAAHGANFMLTMLKLAKDRDTLSVIDDQWGAPTWVGRIVAVTESVILRSLQAPELAPSGLYHLCPKGDTTWHRYAGKIFELAPDPSRKLQTLVPITSAQYETNLRTGNAGRVIAKRPHNSRLDCTKLERDFGITLPSWEEDLASCLSEGKF